MSVGPGDDDDDVHAADGQDEEIYCGAQARTYSGMQ